MQPHELKHPKPEQLSYGLTLTPVAGAWLTPPWQRLRGLLKTALRAYGLKAVGCAPIPPQPISGNHAGMNQERKRNERQ
ncbi:MAG TPA: hypothetical protein PLC99_25045 [Verrucomicrobiota bacterium]|nr:hypothetical protein [Verrucomicrobiota bacterium]